MASSPWAPRVLLSKYVQDVWHEYRVAILLTVFAILLALRLYLLVTDKSDDTERLQYLSKIYGNSTEKSLATPTVQTDSKTIDKPNDKPDDKTASGPRRIKGDLSGRRDKSRNGSAAAAAAAAAARPSQIQTVVFYSSLTGSTAKRVQDYVAQLGASLLAVEKKEAVAFAAPQALDLAEVDLDEYFIKPPSSSDGADFFYLFLVPSYNIDSINDTFLEHLQETHHDFRIDTAPLMGLLGYSVFGFGDKEGWPTEDEGFCFQAKEIDKWMAKLSGRKRAFPLGCGDTKTDAMARLAEWSDGVVDVLGMLAQTGSLGEGVPGSGDPLESDEEGDEDEEEAEEEVEEEEEAEAEEADDGDGVLFGAQPRERRTARKTGAKRAKTSDIDDVEDLGRLLQNKQDDGATGSKAPIAVDFTTYGPDSSTGKASATTATAAKRKEMVAKDSPTYKSLTKQGYAIVGSHSGVKICRWTKSALRGRGSCYKFSFYGIHSHQCMETTPSLSCSNKCVFCWRHGTNPVGTTWRWVVDPPELIFAGVKANHYLKIKSLRGVPGVRAERFAEALRIRHCALSLVGEPIFYPHINEFLGMLHGDGISSFLVCNAQHPDQLAALHHVTQLYVSIDATNRESLRRIDRPLHRDFWERFQRCLDILRASRFRQRTVFRLTLVKGFNVEDEVSGYADLIEQGLPCFIEIKGVTYCGTSTSAGVGLSMANVPFYHEVCDFVVALEAELQARGLGYGLAAEHAHSCCVLIASERFRVDGRWHTLIDYDKFFALLRDKGPTGDFRPEDYMGAATPEWANWGHGGFDPRDQRVDRKGRPIER